MKERNCPMLSVFLYAFNAVVPILLLVLVGYFFRVKEVFPEDFFKLLNTLSFRCGLPLLLFMNIYQLDSVREIDLALSGCILLSCAVMTLLGFALAHLATRDPRRRGVLVQAAFRSNFSIIGLPLSEGLAGAAGIAVAASMQAPTVFYFNFVAVLVLCIYTEGESSSHIRKVLQGLIHNPLLWGIAAGLAVLVVRELMPLTAAGELPFSISRDLPWLYTTMKYLSQIATPVSLIAMGGQFKFSDVPGIRKELITGVAARLLLSPLVGFSITFALQRLGLVAITPAAIGTLIAAYGSPVAVSSVPMAAEMGADDKLASQIVVWSSLLSMGTIFLMAVLFRSIGML